MIGRSLLVLAGLPQRPDLTDAPCSAATMSSVRRTEEVDVSGAVGGAGRTSLSIQGKVENRNC